MFSFPADASVFPLKNLVLIQNHGQKRVSCHLIDPEPQNCSRMMSGVTEIRCTGAKGKKENKSETWAE